MQVLLCCSTACIEVTARMSSLQACAKLQIALSRPLIISVSATTFLFNIICTPLFRIVLLICVVHPLQAGTAAQPFVWGRPRKLVCIREALCLLALQLRVVCYLPVWAHQACKIAL